MRIANWNVNSVRTRAERIVAALERNNIDVLAMQETKAADDKFPYSVFEAAGYEVAHVGYSQWNGVAIASRVGLENVRDHFDRQPGFHKDPTQEQAREARAVGATCGGVDIWSLYVPNGREIGDPHYTYKLRFLYELTNTVNPQVPQVFCGDFNIAPTDDDVWDIAVFEGKTHVTEPERAAFQMLLEAGLNQVTHDEPYTYWDYKGMRFQKNEGMLIDFQLVTPPMFSRVQQAYVDLDEPGHKGSSDHTLLVVDYDLHDLAYDEVR